MKIFVSCTSQKNGEIKADISKIRNYSLKDTFDEWRSLTKNGLPSRDVYKGTQWELIKQIDKNLPTYVISAGYGIIDLNTLIQPYSITFSDAYVENKHILIPRFDLTQKQANKKWFDMFGDLSHLWGGDEVCIFTVNPIYLNVLNLPKKDNIIILNNYRLGRLAKWLGTGANNLNVKFVEYLQKHHPNISGNEELSELVNTLDNQHGQDLYKKRNRVDDQFIKDKIKEGKSLNWLRDNNYGCGKQRFKNLQSNTI